MGRGIAAKLDECSIFIFAVTENSLDSKNCRDELTLARDTDKRFLNVVFSDDIELPRWFKLRYARYQMCYYNRFPSARAVVDDLGQKCEWFEDVKLPALQSAEQEKAEDTSLKDVTTEKETAEKTPDEVQNRNIYREKLRIFLHKALYRHPYRYRKLPGKNNVKLILKIKNPMKNTNRHFPESIQESR